MTKAQKIWIAIGGGILAAGSITGFALTGYYALKGAKVVVETAKKFPNWIEDLLTGALIQESGFKKQDYEKFLEKEYSSVNEFITNDYSNNNQISYYNKKWAGIKNFIEFNNTKEEIDANIDKDLVGFEYSVFGGDDDKKFLGIIIQFKNDSILKLKNTDYKMLLLRFVCKDLNFEKKNKSVEIKLNKQRFQIVSDLVSKIKSQHQAEYFFNTKKLINPFLSNIFDYYVDSKPVAFENKYCFDLINFDNKSIQLKKPINTNIKFNKKETDVITLQFLKPNNPLSATEFLFPVLNEDAIFKTLISFNSVSEFLAYYNYNNYKPNKTLIMELFFDKSFIKHRDKININFKKIDESSLNIELSIKNGLENILFSNFAKSWTLKLDMNFKLKNLGKLELLL